MRTQFIAKPAALANGEEAISLLVELRDQSRRVALARRALAAHRTLLNAEAAALLDVVRRILACSCVRGPAP